MSVVSISIFVSSDSIGGWTGKYRQTIVSETARTAMINAHCAGERRSSSACNCFSTSRRTPCGKTRTTTASCAAVSFANSVFTGRQTRPFSPRINVTPNDGASSRRVTVNASLCSAFFFLDIFRPTYSRLISFCLSHSSILRSVSSLHDGVMCCVQARNSSIV